MRIAPAASAALVALALAGPAAAAYKPKLVAGGGGGETTLHVTWRVADDATQAVTLYAPSAYTLDTTPAVGAKVGTARETIVETANGGVRVRPSGAITTADPTSPPLRAAATECTLNPLHEQVWTATLSGKNPVSLLIFVDRTTPAEAVLGSIKLQFCFRAPDVAEAQGGAPRGGKTVDLVLTVTSTLEAPTTAGDHLWHGLFTPYTSRTKTANRAGTVEAQSVLRVPRLVTLKAKRIGKELRLTGQVSEGGNPLGGASVTIFKNGHRVGTVKTNEDAGFSVTLALPRRASFSVRAVVEERTTSCEGTPVAPAGCTGATVAGFTVHSKKVVVRRRR
jgi:hypothetical protein